MGRHRAYWESFYDGADLVAVPDEPSAFARWVDERLAPGAGVVDIGTGTARDALWFARQGRPVIGVDDADAAVAHAGSRARAAGLDAAFQRLDLESRTAVGALADELATDGQVWSVYARFLVHAVEDDARHHLWHLARTVLAAGGELLLEFRTQADEGVAHVFGEHFRRYLQPDDVAAEIVAAGGEVVHLEAGRGLAVYREEDPVVCRMVATWPTGATGATGTTA